MTAPNRAPTQAEQGAPTRDGHLGQTPEFTFTNDDYQLAHDVRPDLYQQITHDKVAFDYIAKAWRIAHNPAKRIGRKERTVSAVLMYLAQEKFREEHDGILKEYWEENPWAGCALTGDACVHSVMNTDNADLIKYENRVHQLCDDAHQTLVLAPKRPRTSEGDRQPEKSNHRTFERLFRRRSRAQNAERDLMWVGERLYSVLTHVIQVASVLKEDASAQKKSDALIMVKEELNRAEASVGQMIQRQARFEYFEGVGLGALITIPALAVAGWATLHYGVAQFSEPNQPGSFTAAIIGGAVGAVISVTQRVAGRHATLDLDFTAPKAQKIALGALRPLVGAVFGAVAYFAVTGGLLAVEARTGKDASVALAFFAVAGFAAGFSERFATDVLERASSGIVSTGQARQDVEDSSKLP